VTVGAAVAGLYFIHPDHLGTPRLIADAAGTTVWRWDQQEPFGNDTPNGDPNSTGTTFEFPLRLPGQYADRETGLAYNYYRDYDPATGRYVQSDPIGLAGGINTYLFVGGNPLSYTDPTGEFLFPAAIPVVEVIVEAVAVNAARQAAIAAARAAAAAFAAAATQSASTSNSDRDIWWPEKESGNWVCKARADCNDNIPGNCPDDPNRRFSFGGGTASSLGAARNIAKANATSNLQCQPKHVSCKCTGPKGERYSGGC
jgi:RHS repeat-associated protein